MFTIDGEKYTLGWDELVNDYKRNGKMVCDVRVAPLDIRQDGHENLFIVGGEYMKKYLTVFDRANDRVGFYK